MESIKTMYVEAFWKYEIDICNDMEDNNVILAVLGDDDMWNKYDEDIKMDGLCVCAEYIHNIMSRRNECYTQNGDDMYN